MKKNFKLLALIIAVVMVISLMGCGDNGAVSSMGGTDHDSTESGSTGGTTAESGEESSEAETESADVSETKPVFEESTEVDPTEAETPEAVTTEAETMPESGNAPETSEGVGIFYDNGGYLVAIDAGHQRKGNNDPEPVGPGATETKPKVSSGTQGVVTGIAEHEMNLVIALYLRDELLARGYSVLMIRETADVDISNAERALLANSYNADAFVRLHGNGVDRPDPKGALTMCMSPDNPYNGELYSLSHKLSKLITEGMCDATGAVNRGVLETDTMSGINWCKIPVAIVEVGFMSNPEEDRAMARDSYRRALAKGIAEGIDAYFGR